MHSKDDIVSIRLRLSKDLLVRIDRLAGENGRQRFIEDAINWRLDQELPPVVLDLVDQVENLRARVEYLENVQETSVYRGDLKEFVKENICRDEIDERILSYFIQHKGATTPELGEEILGSPKKRRTVHSRIVKMNEQANEHLGEEILRLEKSEIDGKRGAWWITSYSLLVS